MTSTHPVAHHGDVTLTVDVHDGLIEYVLVIDHTQLADLGRLRISDQQARDARHCFADLFPYTYARDVQEPAGTPVPPTVNGTALSGLCVQCADRRALPGDKYCGDVCERNDRSSEYKGWSR